MDERKPWEQMEGEPNRWYQRFSAFRLLGPGRSVEAVFRKEREAAGGKGRKPTRHWYGNAQVWQWKPRAEAWDQFVRDEAEAKWREQIMGEAELLARLSQMARGNIGKFVRIGPDGHIDNLNQSEINDNGHLVKKITSSEGKTNSIGIELHDPQSAMQMLGKHLRLFENRIENTEPASVAGAFALPADVLAPSFLSVYRDVRDRRHMEYLLKGGRGSTKSSFTSLVFIYLLINNPNVHGLALRQVANTLRDSVYSQLVWAIETLGVSDSFRCLTSPLEIEFIPTGQKIYFRGADKPEKIKSIKPTFGHIGILWFEELDQFHGPEAIRKIEQSVLRGGDEAWEFKTYNPPPTSANWVNKYVQVPKANQLQHHSTYLDVPLEWLGQAFIDEAEHLKAVNPKAYQHEYLGDVTGTGGLVFENVSLRRITDEEIAGFDRVTWGGDWGYYPDPADFGPVHYDAARRVLYVFGEYRAWKKSNIDLFAELVRKQGLLPNDLLILDSAEPKSIADFQKYSVDGVPMIDDRGNPKLKRDQTPIMLYGPTCRGAEKGPDSVKYSIKWLQGLTEIVIDPERCPYAADEFIDYEYEQDKDGNFISEYPDKNNHSIDRVRYATNLIWRKRGQ
ncbi:MAG TPA: PBSX family phage terminase large subunit [Anaerolineaceae bacterium]|nr:PBSX family phage terminase large subunit [Anaerolineaceae bacterium]